MKKLTKKQLKTKTDKYMAKALGMTINAMYTIPKKRLESFRKWVIERGLVKGV